MCQRNITCIWFYKDWVISCCSPWPLTQLERSWGWRAGMRRFVLWENWQNRPSGSLFSGEKFFFFFFLIRATPAAYGCSQARGRIRAAAASLHHSNVGSEQYLWPMPQLAGSLTPWARPGIEPVSPWILVRFLTCWATRGTTGENLMNPILGSSHT